MSDEEKIEYFKWITDWRRGENSFRSSLFETISKADLGNKAKLQMLFSQEVKAYDWWYSGGYSNYQKSGLRIRP